MRHRADASRTAAQEASHRGLHHGGGIATKLPSCLAGFGFEHAQTHARLANRNAIGGYGFNLVETGEIENHAPLEWNGLPVVPCSSTPRRDRNVVFVAIAKDVLNFRDGRSGKRWHRRSCHRAACAARESTSRSRATGARPLEERSRPAQGRPGWRPKTLQAALSCSMAAPFAGKLLLFLTAAPGGESPQHPWVVKEAVAEFTQYGPGYDALHVAAPGNLGGWNLDLAAMAICILDGCPDRPPGRVLPRAHWPCTWGKAHRWNKVYSRRGSSFCVFCMPGAPFAALHGQRGRFPGPPHCVRA